VKRFANKERQPAAPQAACLKIDRVYQPRADALDALVDVLYLVVVEGQESPSSLRLEPTCFPRPHE